MKEILNNNTKELNKNARLNLPSTWTKKKMASLLLMSWLSVNGVDGGKVFKDCLIYNKFAAGSYFYDSLIDFDFTNYNVNLTNGGYLRVCCNNSPCYANQTCFDSHGQFSCRKIAGQNIFCNSGSSNCAGIVGDGLITSNFVSKTACPSIQSLSFKDSSHYNGFAYGYCLGDTNCPRLSLGKLWCYWDNGGWTCSDCFINCPNACILQWPSPLPSNNSALTSSLTTATNILSITTSTSATSHFSQPTLSNKSRLTEKIAIPAGVIVGVSVVAGVTYCIVHKKKKDSLGELDWEEEKKEREELELVKLLIKKKLEKEKVERISPFFDTWFNENCTLVISKKNSFTKNNNYRLWIAIYEPSFGKTKSTINLVKIAKKLPRIKERWIEITNQFEKSLKSSEHPATEIYNNIYTFDLPSLSQEYKNVIKIERNMSSDSNPDDYIKPYDIVKVNRKGGAYQHAAIYLGSSQVVHVNNPQGKITSQARIDNWKTFLDGEEKIEIFHSFIPFKKPELIKKHIETAVNTKYGKGKYHLIKNNCEHFATMCVYGLGMSRQKIDTINNVTENSDYLLQAIQASNEFFEKLQDESSREANNQSTQKSEETESIETRQAMDRKENEQQAQIQIPPK